MRKIIGWVLLALGTFLVVIGLHGRHLGARTGEADAARHRQHDPPGGHRGQAQPRHRRGREPRGEGGQRHQGRLRALRRRRHRVRELDVPGHRRGRRARLRRRRRPGGSPRERLDRRLRDRPLRRHGRQRHLPPAERGGEGGPRQQVALRRREEDLPLLGRHARRRRSTPSTTAPRPSTASRPTATTSWSRSSPPRSSPTSTASTPRTSTSGSTPSPARSSTRPSTRCAS